MLSNLDQFYIFLACFSIGAICGIFFSFSFAFKYVLRNKKLKFFGIITDFLAFILTTITYIHLSFKFNFPSFRFYMPIGVFIGVIAYTKSLHILLAKLLKKPYNILEEKIKVKVFTLRAKFTKVKVKHDRIKVKKGNISGNRRRGNAYGDIGVGTSVSINIYKSKA
ncbi:MAG: spore cortex biosynthesis protein YabQ [Clostridia bacterium]|nr:spore cortex biosynthesis protein YabQ [Clostridia bacterium]